MESEREFLKEYIFDHEYGGVFLTIGPNGSIVDPRKFFIAQSNVVLFLKGMDSQSPDDSILKNLKWGHMGSGTWYGFTNRTGGNVTWLVWPPPSESYVSYGLLEAYQYTGNKAYFNAAKANLDHQLTFFPDGHVFTDNNTDRTYDTDVGYRFPERIGHLKMWTITGQEKYKNFAISFQEAYNGFHAREYVIENGEMKTLYLHGISVIDVICYSYILNDKDAIDMGIALRSRYWLQIGNDSYVRTDGQGADNGRDYYQKRLMMDLILWSMTSNQSYQRGAIESYHHLLRFWDESPPNGFWFSLAKIEKTCFSIGYPALIDMTAPILEESNITQSPTFSTIFTLDVFDPNYQWLDFDLKGIGVNENQSYLYYKPQDKTVWVREEFSLENNKLSAPTDPYPPETKIDYFFSLSDNFDNRWNSTVQTYEVQETNLDSDQDELQDSKEIFYTKTDPLNPDTDRDFWSDGIDPWPTDPLSPNLLIGALITIFIAAIYLLKLEIYIREKISKFT
jgi:hypothetical protein